MKNAASVNVVTVSMMAGQIQHGPRKRCDKRWAARSDGVTRSPTAFTGLSELLVSHVVKREAGGNTEHTISIDTARGQQRSRTEE
jgi:hypothetical protein